MSHVRDLSTGRLRAYTSQLFPVNCMGLPHTLLINYYNTILLLFNVVSVSGSLNTIKHDFTVFRNSKFNCNNTVGTRVSYNKKFFLHFLVLNLRFGDRTAHDSCIMQHTHSRHSVFFFRGVGGGADNNTL